jgi:hypothetical protein
MAEEEQKRKFQFGDFVVDNSGKLGVVLNSKVVNGVLLYRVGLEAYPDMITMYKEEDLKFDNED